MDEADKKSNAKTRDVKTYYGDRDLGLGEIDRLEFAKQILLFLFLLVIFVFLASYALVNYGAENKELVSIVNTILDVTKTVVPSTVTLVLGFYFGKKDA